jgi:hypothetical protein
MAAGEGARRIKLVGRALTLGGLGSAVILAGALWMGVVQGVSVQPVMFLLPLMLPVTFLGGVLWIAGWVLEGFLVGRE